MSDKVYGGTPRSQRSLCLNCRNAHVAKGVDLQDRVYCNAGGYGPRRVGFVVVDCSVFDDKSRASRYEMEQIAWTVQSRNRGPIGFAEESRMQVTIEPPQKLPSQSMPVGHED
jgi:hypothetical protein